MPTQSDCDSKKKKSGDAIARKLLKSRSILIFEPISDKLAARVHTQLLLLEQMDPTKMITVYINSPGGSADSGFAIYDSLRFFKPPIRTVVTGLSASAAVLAQLAAPKERRFITPYGRTMLHQPRTQMRGTASDIKIDAEEMVRLRERYNRIVGEACGKTTEQVTKDCDRDFWLDAEQCVAYGLAGKIVRTNADF
jgi:ATP-dependent Clp protease protease subunit